MAGIEAALLLPVMVFVIVGFIELYQYYRAAAILDRGAFTLASGLSIQRDLYDRGQCDDSDDVCTYGAIARDLMEPLDYPRGGQLIFSVYAATEPDGSPPSPVTWKTEPEWRRLYRGEGGEPPGAADAVSQLLPTDLPTANRGDTIIVVELFYDHDPFVLTAAFWEILGGERRMYSRAFYRPRFSDVRELAD